MRTPETVHDERSGEHARCHRGIDVAKLTRFNTTCDDRRDQTMATSHDLFRVKAREIGIVVNLRVNQPEERRELRRPNETPEGAHELCQRFGRGSADLTKLSFALLDLTHDGVTHDLSKQLFLVREIE